MQEDVVKPSSNGAVAETVSGEAAPEKPKRRGRPKGVPNKVNRIAKEAIAEAEPHQFLIRIMEGRKFRRAGTESARKTTDCFPTLAESTAAAELLLRKIAPDLRATELSGPDGQPIQSEQLTVEISQRLSQVFGAVDTTQDKPVAEQLPDEALRAISAVSFLQAQAAAQNGHQLPAVTLPVTRGEAIRVPDPSTSPETGDPSPEAPEAAGSPIDVIEEPEPPEPGFTVAFVTSELSITGCPPDREGLPNVYELKRRGMLMRRAAWPVILDLAKQQSGGDLGAFIVQEPRPQAGQHFASSQDYRRH
jgi:hypothetical protein